MLDEFLDCFANDGKPAALTGTHLCVGDRAVLVRNGIPRFSPDVSYSTGNFSTLRERHATLQLDSKNGTTDRLTTFLDRSGWPPGFLKDKLVLECGCGAGPDTEILLDQGARVVSVDIAGVDVALANLGPRDNLCLVQASIGELPFKPESFDVVYCHRVIMHTPDPAGVMAHILSFRKPGGAAFIHSYSRDFFQMFRWKYALRPLTRRMDPERLYRWLEWLSPVLYPLTAWMNRNKYLRRLAWITVPYINHRHQKKYRAVDDATMRQYAIHETFDALSPRYDNPLPVETMRAIAKPRLDVPFEIFEGRAYVVLRTLAS